MSKTNFSLSPESTSPLPHPGGEGGVDALPKQNVPLPNTHAVSFSASSSKETQSIFILYHMPQ